METSQIAKPLQRQTVQVKLIKAVLFYHDEHLGSTTVVTNESESLVEETFYEQYGGIISDGQESKNQYEGKEFSSVTNDYDFHFRKYDPVVGRFSQPDAVIPNVYDPQSLNRYAFERNNPYKYVDPSGHIVGFDDVLIFLIATVVISYTISFIKGEDYAFNAGQDLGWATTDEGITTFAGGSALGTILFRQSAITSKLISNQVGKIGEKELAKEFGEESQSIFYTAENEKRVFDQFSPSTGTAREAKTGYTYLSDFVKSQIDKTKKLLAEGQISSAELHFYQSPVTGKIGGSKPLLEYAQRADIQIIKHLTTKPI